MTVTVSSSLTSESVRLLNQSNLLPSNGLQVAIQPPNSHPLTTSLTFTLPSTSSSNAYSAFSERTVGNTTNLLAQLGASLRDRSQAATPTDWIVVINAGNSILRTGKAALSEIWDRLSTLDTIDSSSLANSLIDSWPHLSRIIRDLVHTVDSLPTTIDIPDSLLIRHHASNVQLDSNNASQISTINSGSTIPGGIGNDRINVIGNGHIINADSGNDQVSAIGDSNTVNGEVGNDVLAVVGNANVLVGGTGDDILKADGGTNTLIGGVGSDTFLLPDFRSGLISTTPGQSVVQDFAQGIDKLGLPTISISNGTSITSRVLDFNELTIAQQGEDTAISYQGTVLAVLQTIQAAQITRNDFVNPSDLEKLN